MKNKSTNPERNPHFDKHANLLKQARALVQIVEGIRNSRWASERGRLKDTPEWCGFYVAVKEFER